MDIFGVKISLHLSYEKFYFGKKKTKKKRHVILFNKIPIYSGINHRVLHKHIIISPSSVSIFYLFTKLHFSFFFFFLFTTGICSIYNLSILAYLRYRAVCKPLSSTTPLTWSVARISILTSWLCSFIISLPPSIGWGSYQQEAANMR